MECGRYFFNKWSHWTQTLVVFDLPGDQWTQKLPITTAVGHAGSLDTRQLGPKERSNFERNSNDSTFMELDEFDLCGGYWIGPLRSFVVWHYETSWVGVFCNSVVWPLWNIMSWIFMELCVRTLAGKRFDLNWYGVHDHSGTGVSDLTSA